MASTATTASTSSSPTPAQATAAPTQPSVAPSTATTAPTQPSVAPSTATTATTQPSVAPSTATTAPTQPNVAPSTATTAPTQPSVAPSTATTAPTQPSVAPSTATTAPTQPSVAPSTATTAQTQSSVAPSTATTAPTQPSIAPSTATTAPTQPSVTPAKGTAASTKPKVTPAKGKAASTQPKVTPAKGAAASTQPSVTPAKTSAAPTQQSVTLAKATSTSTPTKSTAASAQPSATPIKPVVASTQASPKPAVATVVPAQTSVKPPTSVVSPTQAIVTPIPHAKGAMSQKDMDTLYETPWRKTVNWYDTFETLKDLKDEIENYEPLGDLLTDEVQFPRVNILLLGGVGAGKSSVFNTINSVFRGKIFNVARSGSSEHSLTTKFTRYPVMSASRTLPVPLKFRICDIRGLEQDHLMTKENMRYILEGNIADRFPFDPSGNLSSDMPGFKRQPDLDEKIHCVCLVQDATTVDALLELSPEVTNNLREMQTVMNSLDIPQIVILTKIDSLCAQTKNNPADAFQSPKVEKCVAKVSEVLGLPRNSVFPLKNYEMEYQLDPNIDIMSLLTLKGILTYCDAHLFHHYDEIVKRYAVANRRDP